MSRYKNRKRKMQSGGMDMFGFGQEADERLPYETKFVEAESGTIEVYVIPEEEKAEVLAALYPFTNVPALDEERFDLHAEELFRVGDFLVTREDNQNYLVSPYYLSGGGTVIDWMSPGFAEQS